GLLCSCYNLKMTVSQKVTKVKNLIFCIQYFLSLIKILASIIADKERIVAFAELVWLQRGSGDSYDTALYSAPSNAIFLKFVVAINGLLYWGRITNSTLPFGH